MNRIHSIYLFLLSIWWAWTVLVDMVIVRTVFATVDNFFLAGELGIALFSKLNNFELVVSSAIVALLSIKKSWKLLIVAVLLWALTMTYFCYLTPKIIYLTELWKKLDLMGINTVAGIPDIQQEHQFYHQMYITLDSIKLLTLTGLIGMGIWKEKL